MATLIAIPILAVLVILQTAIFSQMHLLNGTADLILLVILAWALQKRVQTAWRWGLIAGLMVGYVSALPLGVTLVGYLLAVGLAHLLKGRVWQFPLLAMFVATFFGTLIMHAISLAALLFSGDPLPWQTSLNLITLPSVLLNLILAVPAYALLGDLANWLYPEELEV